MRSRGAIGARSDNRQRRALGGNTPFPNVVTDIKIAAYTARYYELVMCDPTAGAFALTLPIARGNRGQMIGVKNASASSNNITVTAATGENIDQSATFVISSSHTAITLVSDGTDWWII